MARFASPLSSVKAAEDSDIMGVIGALEQICEIESRLRHAIQQTHPLTTSLEWDFQAADRERAGLLAIRYAVPMLPIVFFLDVGHFYALALVGQRTSLSNVNTSYCLCCSQQLEYLEDKLRELRFVGAHDEEQKVCVFISFVR